MEEMKPIKPLLPAATYKCSLCKDRGGSIMGMPLPCSKCGFDGKSYETDPNAPNPTTSQGRFLIREQKFINDGCPLPKLRHIYWWLIHNIAAHIMIGLAPVKVCFDFHDWTSRKLNQRQ